jgi:hypothetical protein
MNSHLHECEVCNQYYRHDNYKCKHYTKWGRCEKHQICLSMNANYKNLSGNQDITTKFSLLKLDFITHTKNYLSFSWGR